MPIYKRKYKSGEVVWSYLFSAPGATREDRKQCTASGFASKKDAIEAETLRRIEEQKKYDAGVTTSLPQTLAALLDEFFKQHADTLAPKTVERYRECVAYLAPELLSMQLTAITPLHLNREWKRLLTCGGRVRKSKAPRPMAAKTVRNIAGVVSSAFGRAVRWGLVTTNPCTGSEPPRVPKHRGMSLTTAQQDLLIAASGDLAVFLEVDAALGARRGEVLALRWSDIEDGRVVIGRSLSQTKSGLQFKSTKSDEIRVLALPNQTLLALEQHRLKQGVLREKFGADYADQGLIFCNPDGTPLRPDSISATVSALFKRLNIPKPKGAALHLLRHSHGSHMLANGVPLPAVAARLGHSSVRVTADVYAHEIHGQDDEAIKAWEEFQKRSRATGLTMVVGRTQ